MMEYKIISAHTADSLTEEVRAEIWDTAVGVKPPVEEKP